MKLTSGLGCSLLCVVVSTIPVFSVPLNAPYKFDLSDHVASRDVESYSASTITQRAPGEVWHDLDLVARGRPPVQGEAGMYVGLELRFKDYIRVIGRVTATDDEHTTIQYDLSTKKIKPSRQTFPTESVQHVDAQ